MTPTLLVAALLTGAETALLYLLTAELVGSFGLAPLPWPALWLVGMFAFVLPRALAGVKRSVVYTACIVAAIVLTVLVAVHTAAYPSYFLWDSGWVVDFVRSLAGLPSAAERNVWLVFVSIAAIWQRQVAREAPGSDAAGRLLRFGPAPAALLGVGSASLWGARGPEAWLAAVYIGAFFVLCLLALAYIRWRETPERSASRRGAVALWISSSLAPIVAALLAASLFSALFFGGVAPVLAAVGRGVWTVVMWILLAVGLVVGLVVWAAIIALRWVVSLFVSGDGGRPPPPPQADDAQRRLDEAARTIGAVPTWVVWAAIALGVVLVLVLITRYRPRRETTLGNGVERESAWESPDVLAALGGLLRRRSSRRRRDPLDDLLADARRRHTVTIRRAYRKAQRLYLRAGRGRTVDQTVGEHARREPSAALRELSALYEEARYGDAPADEAAARRATKLSAAIQSDLAASADGARSNRKDPP